MPLKTVGIMAYIVRFTMGVARGCSGCRCTPKAKTDKIRGLNLGGKLQVSPPEEREVIFKNFLLGGEGV